MSKLVTADVRLLDGMAFEAHSDSGYVLRLDASKEAGGAASGMRPIELLLLGLGGCTGMDVIGILRKMRQNVTGYELHVRGERRDEHPMVFTRIAVEHVVAGP
ncbi:MAG TPA: OsmC family protein, partial [Chloroflexota bacterium]|nr:OsmC family protein [Chloroflexota bacterium]